MRRRSRSSDAEAIAVWEIVGAMLRYPDDTLVAALPAIRDSARSLATVDGAAVAELADRWLATPLRDLRAEYVEVFDMHRSCALDMSWHQFGDRRQRGLVLLNLVRTYQAHGFGPASGELPDWLPLMLEFAVRAPAPAGRELLTDWRAAIELVRAELDARGAPQVALFDVLSHTLGAVDRTLKETVARLLADGPPGEDVGLLPFGPGVELEHGMMPPVAACPSPAGPDASLGGMQ